MTIVSLKYSVLVSLSFLESIDNLFVPRNNDVFYFFFTQPQGPGLNDYISQFLGPCMREDLLEHLRYVPQEKCQ